MMKKIILATALLLELMFVNSNALACDKGCTLGGNYLGIMPQFHKNFIGVRFNSRHYTFTETHTHLHEDTPHVHQEITKEQYYSYEIWGRFYPTKRIQAFLFMPYIYNTQTIKDAVATHRGLGDMTVLVNYTLLNNVSYNSKDLKQTLLLGGGIKLPTGAYKAKNSSEAVEPSLQPGTGSVDLLANGTYTLRYKKVGFNSDFTYRFNTESKTGYRFGNRYNGSANLFYWYEVGKIAILPSTGLYLEKANPDSFHDATYTQMGGEGLFANAGLNIYYKNVAVGGNLQKPISQHQHAGQLTKINPRTSLNISFMF